MENETQELSRDEVKAQLTQLGVPFKGNAKTTSLVALLEAQAHVVTEEDLVNNPTFVEEGIEVGETIYLPYAEEEPEATEDAPSDDAPEDEAEAGDEGEHTPEAPTEPEMPTETADYEVLRNVKHNGTRYSAGDELRLNPEDAIPLLKAGAIK